MYRKRRNDFTDDVLPWIDLALQGVMLYYAVKICDGVHRNGNGGGTKPAIIEVSPQAVINPKIERNVENEMQTNSLQTDRTADGSTRRVGDLHVSGSTND